jgi:hypothetical protein
MPVITNATPTQFYVPDTGLYSVKQWLYEFTISSAASNHSFNVTSEDWAELFLPANITSGANGFVQGYLLDEDDNMHVMGYGYSADYIGPGCAIDYVWIGPTVYLRVFSWNGGNVQQEDYRLYIKAWTTIT